MRSARSPQLDELVALASKLCEAPAALLTILERDTVWIRASAGIDDAQHLSAQAICADVLARNETILTSFEREWDGFTFLAGTPVSIDGSPAGALCVLDRSTRRFSPDQRVALEAIARTISSFLVLERAPTVSRVDDEAIQAALELTDNGIAILSVPNDGEPQLEYANDASLRRAGMTLSEALADNARFLQRYGQTPVIGELLARVKAGSERSVDHTTVPGDGRRRWFEVRAKLLTPAADGSARIVIFSRDVTGRKTAEDFRHLLSEAIEQTPESVHIVRMDGTALRPQIVYANSAFSKLTGFDPSHEYPQILGPESNVECIREAARAVNGGGTTEGETVLYRKDGSRFLASWRAHPVDAPERHAVIIIRDVTGERRRERELHMLSAAIEEGGDFLIVVDDTPADQGGPRTVYVNRALREVTGFSEEELHDYMVFISPQNSEQTLEAVRERIANGAPDYREILLRRKDGTDFWAEYTARVFIDPETKRTFRFAVGRDITARRRSFNQIALLLAATQHSSDAIALYEPTDDGSFELTYANKKHEETGSTRLLDIWQSDDRPAREIRKALEAGDEVRQILPELDAQGLPRLVHFGARSIRNASRLEAIATLERVLAEANEGSDDDGHAILLRVAAMLPALLKADSGDQRFSILRAMLRATFGAEIVEDVVRSVRIGVQVSSMMNAARFRFGDRSYTARWPNRLTPMALTALRLCIEAAIEEPR